MRRVILLVLFLLALGAGGWYGWNWWSHGRFIESTNNAAIDADIVVIAPKVSGYVRSLPIHDNQRVAQGDVLLVLDDVDSQAALAGAQATRAAKEAQVAARQAELAQLQAQLDALAAGVAQAQAARDWAALELDRYQSLAAEQSGSKQRLQQARSDAAQAEAALTQALAALKSGEAQLSVLAANQQQAKADLQAAEALVMAAQNDLAEHTVTAPIDGVVGNRAAELGAFLQAGSEAMVLVPLPDIYVVANFKETQLERLRIGQAVTVTVDAFPDVALTGVIESFAPASGALFSLLPPENATGNYTKIVQRVPVRIRLELPSDFVLPLVPGLSAEVAVDTRSGPAN